MKNPFFSIDFVFIVLLMLGSGMGFIGLSFAFIAGNESFEFTSIFIILISIVVFGICIKYIHTTDKNFKKKVIHKILNDSNPILHFKYSKSEWKSYANKYYKEKLKDYNIAKIIFVSVYLLIVVLAWFNTEIKMLLLITSFTFLFELLLFLIFKAKFKEFKNGLITKINPEIKITRNGILFNNKFLISYNNQDNFLGETKQYSFRDEPCLKVNVESSDNGEVGGTIIHPYYILIPKKSINEIDFYIKKMNDNITSFITKKRRKNEINI